jgi:hypothetical protein
MNVDDDRAVCLSFRSRKTPPTKAEHEFRRKRYRPWPAKMFRQYFIFATNRVKCN